jgi:hypothetical protein
MMALPFSEFFTSGCNCKVDMGLRRAVAGRDKGVGNEIGGSISTEKCGKGIAGFFVTACCCSLEEEG